VQALQQSLMAGYSPQRLATNWSTAGAAACSHRRHDIVDNGTGGDDDDNDKMVLAKNSEDCGSVSGSAEVIASITHIVGNVVGRFASANDTGERHHPLMIHQEARIWNNPIVK
jgi:hypothetical protein